MRIARSVLPGFPGSTGFSPQPSRARGIQVVRTTGIGRARGSEGQTTRESRETRVVGSTEPPLDCPADTIRLTVLAPHHGGPVYVRGGRVVVTGTAPEYQRLVGLTRAALTAYATRHGWRVVEDTRPRIGT